MSDNPKFDESHGILSDLAEQDVEQPGDSPVSQSPDSAGDAKQETEDAPRIDD